MKNQNVFEESSGQLLRTLLKTIFPFDEKEKSIFKRMDDALKGDNIVFETIYESHINYVLRRFVTLSRFLYRKYKDDEAFFVRKLRITIEKNFDLPVDDQQFEKLITLLSDCARIAGRPLKTGETTSRFKSGGEDQKCYICGKTVVHPRHCDSIDGATLDHLFPNAFGGSNSSANLKIACAACNSQKRDMIDSTDSHYESICLITDSDDESFQTAMNRQIRIALWAKNNFKCSYCDKSASYMGELHLSRINNDDNWHYFNIAAYCEGHK